MDSPCETSIGTVSQRSSNSFMSIFRLPCIPSCRTALGLQTADQQGEQFAELLDLLGFKSPREHILAVARQLGEQSVAEVNAFFRELNADAATIVARGHALHQSFGLEAV